MIHCYDERPGDSLHGKRDNSLWRFVAALKMLDNCHLKEVLSSVGLPQQGSNRGKSPEQLIYGLFTGEHQNAKNCA